MTSKIFEPVKIGKLELRNRIIRSATWDGTASDSGEVTERSETIYHGLSTGGIGLIIIGYAYISPLGQSRPGQYGMHNDSVIPGWRKIVNDVHKNGGKIAAQIVHGGANSPFLTAKGVTLWAVSSLPELTNCHEMTGEEIEGVISSFAAAAIRAREAGFDAIQLHSAHGYLMSQFVSPLFNHRTDQWGGSPENRRRFHLEVIRRVRKAVGQDCPVLIKFGVQDDKEGGLPQNEGVAIARDMDKAGIDAIEISANISNAAAVATKKGGEIEFRQRAAAVKRTVTVPVSVVKGIRSLESANDIIGSGDADLVSMCRPFIREPHIVLRWLQGDATPATCISCSKCSVIMERGEMMECGVDRQIREKAALKK